MSRPEFLKKTKLQEFRDANGKCRNCKIKLTAATGIEYHHSQECTFGGSAELHNCVVLCKNCHRAITSDRQRAIAKSNRQRDKHLGIKSASGRSLPYGKTSKYKKKVDGRVVER